MARLTRNDRAASHRLGPHALDDADDEMPYLDVLDDADTAYFDVTNRDTRGLDAAGVDDGPLRFDAPAASAGYASSAPDGYVAPRPSRWMALRGPVGLAVVAGLLLGVTWVAWTPVLDGVSDAAAELARREGDGQTQVSVTVGLIALSLFAFIGAWWKHSHPRRPVRLADGRGTIAVDGVVGQFRVGILDLAEVFGAEVAVVYRGGGQVRVRTWLRVTAEARIDDALDGVDTAADWLVHHRLGLMLSEPPLAEVRYDELNLRAARASSSSGASE